MAKFYIKNSKNISIILIIGLLIFVTFSNIFSIKHAKGQTNEGYLIITRNIFRNSLEPLVNQKTAEGLQVNLETVDNIVTNFSGRDVPERIRNYIKQKYSEIPNLKWLLIVGDADPDDNLSLKGSYSPTVLDKNWEVPVRYLYEADDFKFVTSDFYYSNLDGTWDDNGNNIFGEYQRGAYEEGHWFPNLYAGRLPVQSVSELQKIINKILNYQPPNSDKFLFVNYPNLGDFANKLTAKGITYKQIQGPTKSDFINEINSGNYSSIVTMGHSDGYTLWNLSGTDPYFQSQDAAQLTNHYFFGGSYTGCGINRFDLPGDTIPEASLKNPNGGSIFSFGPAKMPAGSYIDFQFYDEYLSGHTKIGEAFYRALYQGSEGFADINWQNSTLFGYARTRIIENVLLGDPELELGNIPFSQPSILSKIPPTYLFKYGDGGSAKSGNQLYFVIYIVTTEMAKNLEISDVVPDEVSYVAGSASDGGQYDPATKKIIWRIQSLAPGLSTKYVRFLVQVK